jgi:Sulfatase
MCYAARGSHPVCKTTVGGDHISPIRRSGHAWAIRRNFVRPHCAAAPDPSFEGEIEVAFKDSKADWPEPLRAPQGAPNVLLIMGDDIGYGHMSAFGGPADTPVFDRLAQQGLRFTNSHTTPVCAASRAAILTGRNPHSVGMGAIPEASIGFPGYNAVIPRSAATMLEILRQNGYGTAVVGKYHNTPIDETTSAGPFDRWPIGKGAEYFYGFFGPGVSQWYPPLWENTTPVRAPKTPEDGYHLEADMADRTFGWIQRQRSIHPGKPWIAYTPRARTSLRSVSRVNGSRGIEAGSTRATTYCATASWPARRSSGSFPQTRGSRPGPRGSRRGRS